MTTHGPSIEVFLALFDPTYTTYLKTCDAEGCETVVVYDGDTGENYAVNYWAIGEDWTVEETTTEFIWSDFYEKDFCLGCIQGEHASTIVFYEAPDGDKSVVHFSDCEVAESEYGEVPDWFTTIGFKDRTYKNTDGWRGFYDTKFDNLTMLESGWVTGDWDDVPWKRDMHLFVAALEVHEIVPPMDLFIVYEPTSNVFSTACGIWARDCDVEVLREWLDNEVEYDVHKALG